LDCVELLCDFCGSCFHAECLDLTEEDVEALEEWLCGLCEKERTVRKEMNRVARLSDAQLAHELSVIEAAVTALEGGTESDVALVTEEELQRQVRELVTKRLGRKVHRFTHVPEGAVPIKCDVTTFDWNTFIEQVEFDVVVMDPPWKLATSNPTRGVAIGYDQLPDTAISDLPIPRISPNGYIFLWVINAKYSTGIRLMQQWGYTLVDELVWVKETVKDRLAKSHGYYLQHAKESCLIGFKGPQTHVAQQRTDVLLARRRGQSQKPDELYSIVEDLVPNGRYIEIFARRNNLRAGWVSLGNEL
jgi:mRNA (2'-O-methyladenosine-N6-)-methyltransferase